MKLLLIAVGAKLPLWAQAAFDDYAKRLPPDWRLSVKSVKLAQRAQTYDAVAAMAQERKSIEALIPQGAHVVALDERGDAPTSLALAREIEGWMTLGRAVVLVIGGPDGLDAQFKQSAAQRLRLSNLTLPHAMARVLLIEQLYRAWSIHAQHPYHRE